MTQILGIDIGGSAVKGAPVDIQAGKLVDQRLIIELPKSAKVRDTVESVGELVAHFRWKKSIGCTFPGVIRQGVIYTSANLDKAWVEVNGAKLLARKTGCPVYLINDADAAGIAEMEFGAGVGKRGLVMMLTFGTGIGSALFVDGKLVPNTELGHVELRGKDAETRAAARVRTEKNLSWQEWGERVNEYLGYLEKLFSPDLFIIGGGVSKCYKDFFPYLETRAKIVPAKLRNDAGIVGAALAAKQYGKL